MFTNTFLLKALSLFVFLHASLMAKFDFNQPLKPLLDPKVYEAPAVFPVPEKDEGVVQAIFYQTLDFKGQPTRAFAYVGIPESEQPVPAMVLVHGGGGKAFHEWVKIWNDRGYAAISMSLEGHMPDENGEGKYRHAFSGPERVGMFDDVGEPLEAQWMYHAVSDIMLAHSLLASLPEVDASRIGITGISWGGVLTSLISGVDDRFRCAVPVYGAGFLYESVGYFKNSNTPQKKFWDPSNQFLRGSMPTLWVNGDCDAHFSVNITSRSHLATADRSFMVVHPSMPHGHGPGWSPQRVPEIYRFVDHALKAKGPAFLRVTQQPAGLSSVLRFESVLPVVEAKAYYLNEPIVYRKETPESRHALPGPWQVVDLEVDFAGNAVMVQLPDSVKTYYVNLKDASGCMVTSALIELD